VRVVVVAILLGCRPVSADVELGARPELRVGAGYDDNLFLDAQQSGVAPSQVHADAIFDLEPRLTSWLEAKSHLLVLRADYLERATVSTGDLRDFALDLNWRLPTLGPLHLLVGGRYEHWETLQYPLDTFDLGGIDAVVQLRLGRRTLVEGLYRFAGRDYSAVGRVGQLDLDQRVHGRINVHALRWLDVETGYTYVHISSNVLLAELDRHRVDFFLMATPLGWLSLKAGYAVAYQYLPHTLQDYPYYDSSTMQYIVPQGPRTDVLQSFEAALSARPTAWLELFARYSLLVSTSDQPFGRYQRNQVVAGLGVSWGFDRRWTAPRPFQPRMQGEQVTFRYRAPPGSQVAVVGDWNAWEPQPLKETQSGVFEGTYTVVKGRHEYAFSVNGNPVAPVDATSYVPDGFGGKSGVIDVD
jgi:hypothetical protein